MRRYVVLGIACAAALNMYAQQVKAPKYGKKLSSREVVEYLASDALAGRDGATRGDTLASDFIFGQMKKLGLEPSKQQFNVKKGDINTFNVYGSVPGRSGKYVVVGAHYDHLGMGGAGSGSRRMDTLAIHNGADDNASGVATVLEVAKMVSSGHFMFRRSVIFAFFGSNELGMAGSWYFLNRSFGEVENIVAMINLDMVGRSGRDNSMQVFVAGLNREMTAIANKLSGRALSIAPEQTYTDYFPSDHRNFYEKGMPSVMFTSGVHRDYRTVRDTPDKLDYSQMAHLAEYVYSMALELSDRDARIAMNPMQQPQQKGKEVIYSPVTVDKMATFMHGGIEKFLEKWVYEYIKYPDSAVRNGIRGTVIAEFVVDEKGKVKDVAVTSGLDDEIDAQVMKVVSASPKWKPATVGGKPVSVKISVPVEFKLAKSASFKIKK